MTMTRDEKVDLLAAVPAMAPCSPAQLREIARHCDLVTASPGNVLMREGARAYEVFLILRGQAEVSRGGSHVALRGPGDYLGEIGVLACQTRDAEVSAHTPMTLLVFSAREFIGLMTAIPPLNRAVLTSLASRLHDGDVLAGAR
jgi:CRP/FNR family cyclic AMP-dependent transcriptional regulator